MAADARCWARLLLHRPAATATYTIVHSGVPAHPPLAGEQVEGIFNTLLDDEELLGLLFSLLEVGGAFK